MGLKDDLIAARALIDTPEKWGKGRGDGGPTAPALCAVGACYGSDSRHFGYRLVIALQLSLPADYADTVDDGMAVARYNDAPSTTHADIVALFDRAIAKAEA